MTKKTIIQLLTALGLIIYLIVAVAWSVHAVNGSVCREVRIIISDDDSIGFVTKEGIIANLEGFCENACGEKIGNLDIAKVAEKLNSNDRIESASVLVVPMKPNPDATDGARGCAVKIKVTPMKPVARVFDGDKSYYINRDGKHISADTRFRIDVPIISGHFTKDFQPVELLPLFDQLAANSRWHDAVAMVEANSPNSVILVPSIMGHVINIGNISNLDNKLERVERFYDKVLSVKGWNYYDSISVKWDNQVVATKRNKTVAVKNIEYDLISESDIPEGTSDEADLMSTKLVEPADNTASAEKPKTDSKPKAAAKPADKPKAAPTANKSKPAPKKTEPQKNKDKNTKTDNKKKQP